MATERFRFQTADSIQADGKSSSPGGESQEPKSAVDGPICQEQAPVAPQSTVGEVECHYSNQPPEPDIEPPDASNGIPAEWFAGLARLRVMDAPDGISLRSWRRIVETAEAFVTAWGGQAHSLGWQTSELFGVHRDGLWVRFGSMGLVVCLAEPEGQNLESMDREKAVTRTKSGATLNFRRACHNMDRSPLRMIWD